MYTSFKKGKEPTHVEEQDLSQKKSIYKGMHRVLADAFGGTMRRKGSLEVDALQADPEQDPNRPF